MERTACTIRVSGSDRRLVESRWCIFVFKPKWQDQTVWTCPGCGAAWKATWEVRLGLNQKMWVSNEVLREPFISNQ